MAHVLCLACCIQFWTLWSEWNTWSQLSTSSPNNSTSSLNWIIMSSGKCLFPMPTTEKVMTSRTVTCGPSAGTNRFSNKLHFMAIGEDWIIIHYTWIYCSWYEKHRKSLWTIFSNRSSTTKRAKVAPTARIPCRSHDFYYWVRLLSVCKCSPNKTNVKRFCCYSGRWFVQLISD